MGNLLLGSVELGLIYAIMSMGVYISFRILNLPDMTVDGSYVLGMAVCAVVLLQGHPLLAVLCAAGAGALAGTVTGLLQTKAGLQPILAGILTMTGLYTINMFVLGGRSNVSASGMDTLFGLFAKTLGLPINGAKIYLIIIINVICAALMILFFKTRPGIAVRATGDNESMVRASSINADAMKVLGFAISNALVAVSGAVLMQYQSSVDIGYGSGMVVIGLASVIIGETVLGTRGITSGFIFVCLGSVIYRIIIAYALKVEILPTYGVKLISAVVVTVALTLPKLKSWIKQKKAVRDNA